MIGGRHSIGRGIAGATAIAVALTLVVSVTATGDSDPRRGGGGGGVQLREVGDFDSPIFITAAPGFADLLFVVERDGRIVVLRDGKRAGTFLDIGSRVSTDGERGLLSVAFPPDYKRSRRFYVYYTDYPNGDIEVDQFRRSPDSAIEALPESREEIITIPHPGATNHNGGTAAFGPDGKLYLATGDGGTRAANAQDKGSLLGKVLRIDPRPQSKRGYRIPRGNPYRKRGGENEIYSIGLRNPFRFAFDRGKPLIAIADVGSASREEINYLRVGEARGANFGWPEYEGNLQVGGSLSGKKYKPPMHDYPHDGDNCSVTGGVTVHDKRLKGLRGRYLYADHCAGEVRSFKPRLKGNQARADRAAGVRVGSPVAFGEDRAGHVYAVSLDGSVYRLVPGG